MNKDQLYGNFKKTVQFTDSAKRYADMRIQLHFDGLRQGEFFRGLVLGYLERDPDLMKFLEKLKECVGRYSKTKRKVIKKSDANREENSKMFALDKDDVESIFDLLEKEFPEL
tara:strand:+ start:465 stop:803 length:339 start_codon:yes stop_codon:yes gene_type:complete